MNTNKLKKKQKQKEIETKKEKRKIFPVENIIFSVGVKIRQNFPINPIQMSYFNIAKVKNF